MKELDKRLNSRYDKLIIPRLFQFKSEWIRGGDWFRWEEERRERIYLKWGKYDSFYVGSIDWEGLILFDSLRIQFL